MLSGFYRFIMVRNLPKYMRVATIHRADIFPNSAPQRLEMRYLRLLIEFQNEDRSMSLNRHPLHEITQQDIVDYARAGVVCLREVLDPDWIKLRVD